MIKKTLHDGWKMRRTDQDRFYEAKVPGTVYTDLLDNGLMEDPYYRDNEDAALKLMDYDYEYVTTFGVDEAEGYGKCTDVLLRFDMIDTVADVFLNGGLLGSVCNQHRTYEFQVKELLKTEAFAVRTQAYCYMWIKS